jgi:hypothetical protein
MALSTYLGPAIGMNGVGCTPCKVTLFSISGFLLLKDQLLFSISLREDWWKL